MCLLLASVSSMAGGVEIDGINYEFNSETKTASVVSGEYSGAVTIPSSVNYNREEFSVTSIGDNAFSGCSGLTSVTIPNSVTSIGWSAFIGCTNLTEIHLSDIAAWCEFDVSALGFSFDHGYHLFLNDKEIKDLFIPDGVTKIGKCAFRSFTYLTSVTIPGSVTSLDEGAFSRCSGLTSVNMSEGLTTIGSFAFDYCSSLTSITIPSSVEVIGSCAFQYCTGLTDITCYATWPPQGTSNAFDNSTRENATLHVPGGYIKLYKDDTSWGKFSSIKPIDGLDNYVNLDGICYVFSGNNAIVSYVDAAYSGNVVIPESVTHNGKTYHVTSIDNAAFYCCTSVTSVEIPNSVTTIGVSAFEGCSSLTSVTIGNNVTEIGDGAFCYCTSLTSVTIPSSVTVIGEYAFYVCSGLTSVTIPNSVTEIGERAFSGCSGLTSVTIPNSVTEIGNGAFSGCSGLTSVAIPNSVTSIGNYSFSSCSSLTSVAIPNSVTEIGESAFRNCSSLTSVTIPNSVTEIGESAFEGCSGLTSVHITDIAAWCKINFKYSESNPLYWAHHLFMDGKEITDLVIPNSVTEIGKVAFYGCSGLTSVTIPNSVTEIGGSAFYNCSGLTSVTLNNNTLLSSNNLINIFGGQVTAYVIGDEVTSIGARVFYGCRGLTSVTIGKNVTSIGDRAFRACSGLTNVYCYAETVPTSSSDIFTNTPIENATLHVPAASLDAYKATEPWSKFKDVVALTELELSVQGTIDGGTTETARYTLDGKRTSQPRRGVNIIRMSDGTTRKVVVK